ncbi:MBOAT-domain-containing protein [Clavulina sp. PMI_390]|nr:MBOAT-domain-containing protein [Clavulina sp. PMI_390]
MVILDPLFNAASSAAGLPVDQLKLIFCLLVAYPLGSLYTRVPTTSPTLRHGYSIATALFFLTIVFHLYFGVAQLVAESLFTYFAARFVRSSSMPWIVFAATMGHLTVNHAIRAIYGVGLDTVEITGAQMVLTMKLTTFAWNVYDGRRPVAELDASQLATRIVEFPSLLSFFGYVFYFPGILVGPTVEYTYYEQLVTGKLFASVTAASEGSGKVKRVPEGRKRVAYTKMLLGLFFLGVYAASGGNYEYERLLEPEFRQLSAFSRFTLIQVLGFVARTKYYGVWLLTEGACILTGLGFNGYGKKGETLWNRTANIDIANIEFAPNFKVLLDSWNMNTNVWLRNCVYKRVTPKGKKPGFSSTMITFLTSAFWHGIAVGYYMSFFLGGFIQHVARLARQYFRPFVLLPNPGGAALAPIAPVPPTLAKRAYDAAGILISITMLNYAVAPFQLLDWKRSVAAWHAMDWYGHALIVLAMVFFNAGGAKTCAGMLKKRGIDVKAKKGPAKPTPMSAAPVGTNGTTTPVTPGVLGAPNGFSLVVPNVDQGVKQAASAMEFTK